MRPLRLTMSAFGPYAGEQSLDFGELDRHAFFLIHGPTGAGKTTIFDAICCALYGQTSGDARDGRQMRSHHADPNTPTELAFEFALGGRQYRVRRRPEQQRPKKRGEGFVTDVPTAELCRRQDDGAWKVLAAKWTDVTTEVEALLGFRADQFRQVVMLPQGQFRTLLEAPSQKRQEVLETLFQTGVYTRIERALKDAAAEIERQAADLAQREAVILEQAQAASVAELAERKAALAAQCEQAARTLAAARRGEQAARETLERGRDADAKLRERDDARKRLADLDGQRSAMAARRAELDRARQAASLADVEAAVRRCDHALRQAQQQRDAAAEAHRRAEEQHRTTATAWVAQQQRQPQRDEAVREAHRLEALAGAGAELAAARAQLETARAEAAALAQRQAKLSAEREAAARQVEERSAALAAAERTAAQVEARRLALAEAKRLHEARLGLDALDGQLRELEADYAAAEAAAQGAHGFLRTAREDLAALQRRWDQGQAAVLAASLEPGRPCPVCGGTDHPAPARAEEEPPTQAKLERLRRKVEELDANRAEADRALAGRQAQRAQLRAEHAAVAAGLEGAADRTAADLAEALARATAALDEARRAAEEASTLAGVLQGLRERQAQRDAAGAELQQRAAQATQQCQRAQATADERSARLPEDLRTPDALAVARAAAAERVRRLSAEQEQARQALAAAERALAETAATVRECERQLREAAAQATAQQDAFAARLLAAGLADTEAYAAARRSDEQIRALDADLQQYHANLQAARERVERAAAAAEGLAPADLPALQAAAEEARAALVAAVQADARAQSDARQAQDWLGSLAAARRRREDLEQRFQAAGRIAEVASGTNPYRVTFQRFVLGALLDDVLVAASQRLRVMSRGRYELQRQREQADQRRAGGLDLEVFDGYTGTTRPAGTLSGGEGFLASLALALGLADVVQAYAGGVFLETIFVDEGFGSLDAESLDLALRALMDLQQNGRLVGIISHVADLRTLVPARLEVSAGRRGSVARFVVP